MKPSLGAAGALLFLLAGPAAAQVNFEAAGRFHDQALRPAIQAVTGNEAPEARRLARVVAAEFDKLPPALQTGQVSDMQRLGRLYLDKKLVEEADLLLTRAVAAWERSMGTTFPPLGPVRGDVEGAEKLLRRMIDFADRMKGWEYVPNLIAVFEAYAEIVEQGGRTAEARPLRSRAATIRKNYR